jgi:anthranilate phosphoribosyltransferase
MRSYLNKLLNLDPLTADEIKSAVAMIISGNISNEQISAFLFGFSMVNIDEKSILSFIKALKVNAKNFPKFNRSIDVCGTGGDNLNMINVSTAVSLVLSCYDCVVLKHGNKAVSSQSGSSDVLVELGVGLDIDNKILQNTASDLNIAFLNAPQFYPFLKKLAPIRKSLGIKTILNLLGPLLNPSEIDYQLMGVYDRKYHPQLISVLRKLNRKSAMIVTGFDNADEISLSTDSYITEYRNGKIKQYTISPKVFGLNYVDISKLQGKGPAYNAEKLLKLLSGEKSPYLDLVAMNTSAALYVMGYSKEINTAINDVYDIISSGKVLNKLKKIVKYTND